jgi:phosphatidylglycerophosphatase C
MAKPRLAIFDFCKTLVGLDTVVAFLRYLEETGRSSREGVSLERALNVIDTKEFFSSIKRLRLLALKGLGELEVQEIFGEFYRKAVAPAKIAKTGKELRRLHQDQHDIVLVSASFGPILSEYVRELGVPARIVANRIEFNGGICTGRMIGPDCIGVQKLIQLKKVVDLSKYDLKGSSCYTDHISDFPLLALVGKRFAVKLPGTPDDWSHLLACETVNV